MRAWLPLLALAACVPQPTDPDGPVDGRQFPLDAASGDRAGDGGTAADGSGLDGGFADRRVWSEDAGVAYTSYLDCLQGAITLGACYLDARGRATAAGPAGLSFARATGAFDAQGLVPADQPGLVYQFCREAGGSYECVSVEYWWSGVTAQIALGRVHNSRSGAALGRELTSPPDSPEMMAAFAATDGCNFGASGYASVELYCESGQDRVRISSDQDTLVLADPALTVIDNYCQ
ncbi:MAG: hypothetical protein JXR83_15820 [Deltaproteobacteria bacterium]|nr:hypothetical protein [Deltaproteobacteria bacterium]